MHDELWTVGLDDCSCTFRAEDMRQISTHLQVRSKCALENYAPAALQWYTPRKAGITPEVSCSMTRIIKYAIEKGLRR
jgi:hypothetical protein